MNYIKKEYSQLNIINIDNVNYDDIIEKIVLDELTTFYIEKNNLTIGMLDKYDIINNKKPSLNKEYVINLLQMPTSSKVQEILEKHLFKKMVLFVNNKLICEYRNLECGYFPRQVYRSFMALRYLWYFKDDFRKFIEENAYKNIIVISEYNIKDYLVKCLKNINIVQVKKVEEIERNTNSLILDFKYGEDYKKFIDTKISSKFENFFYIAEYIIFNKFIMYCQENNINYRFVKGPVQEKLTCLSDFEKNIFRKKITLNKILSDNKIIKKISNDEDDYTYLKNRLLGATYTLNNGFSIIQSNVSTKYLNINNGLRKTIPDINSANNEVHIFGPCIAHGYMVSDRNTIESYLQTMVNNYKVYNHGTNNGQFLLCDIINALNTPIRSNDYFIFILENDPVLEKLNIRVHDTNDFFNKNKKQNITFFYDSPAHCNKYANELLAQYIYNLIDDNNDFSHNIRESFFSKITNNVHQFNYYNVTNPDLCSFYIRYNYLRNELKKYKKIGGILAHAAPFTKGHRFLIEAALKEVDAVLFFVMGDFLHSMSVLDRVEIAKINTNKYSNVYVVPIESFAIAATYFPAYALRSNKIYSENSLLQYTGEMVDKYIFGYFNIKYRFLGEEEEGSFTDKYNKLVEKNASIQGISVRIIPRSKDKNNNNISATNIRTWLHSDNLDLLKDVLDMETYNYICNNNIKIK